MCDLVFCVPCHTHTTHTALTQLQAAPYMASLELLECVGCGLLKVRQDRKFNLKLRSSATSVSGTELAQGTIVCGSCAPQTRAGGQAVQLRATESPARESPAANTSSTNHLRIMIDTKASNVSVSFSVKRNSMGQKGERGTAKTGVRGDPACTRCVHPPCASPRLAPWPRCPLLRRAKHVSRRTVGRAATSRQGPMSSVQPAAPPRAGTEPEPLPQLGA